MSRLITATHARDHRERVARLCQLALDVFGHARKHGDQLAQFAQDGWLGSHAHIDGGHRHVGCGCDVGHGRPGIAALDEEGSCCVEDGLAGGRRLILPALGVVFGP